MTTAGTDDGRRVRERVRLGAAARRLLRRAEGDAMAAATVLVIVEGRRREARTAYEAARAEAVWDELRRLPLSRLRETTKDPLRLGPLEAVGYTTVASVVGARVGRLQVIGGVGPDTAGQIAVAAYALRRAIERTIRVRFDVDGRPDAQTSLLGFLRHLEAAEQLVEPVRDDLVGLAARVATLLPAASLAGSCLRMLFAGSARRRRAREALGELHCLVAASGIDHGDPRWQRALGLRPDAVEIDPSIWDDYQERAVAYNGLLVAIAGLDGDPDAVHGHIPSEIAERIDTHSLDTSLLDVSLRGYQAFGARFALAQGRAMLGDEMGLGKTIEALAAIGHLHASGATHSLVVCPASVLANWAHEIERHSVLPAFRLHGDDRRRILQAWVRRGGVGVVTYDSLRSLVVPDGLPVALLVADEAHYVKNPAAQRTQATLRHIRAVDRVLFLTGTPMENCLEEFRNLVAHLRPDLAARMEPGAGLVGADAFRAAVADVYLRRNQSDVLAELPPRIDNDEWVEPTPADRRAYARAVRSGNFMAMRRAAFDAAGAGESAKLHRLVEIVDEAAGNGWKTVVFSSFLDVLRAVDQALDRRVAGLLTGRLDPTSRQALVDQFSASPQPLVLVSQIQAGGIGLNIQAASVVVLTEPQWKPSIEDQAVARLHRLGQVRPVHVHRLLAEGSVDQRMLEILTTKRHMFDEYVRMSDLKDASPHAIDVSAPAAAPQAQAERRIIELERRRLGLTADDTHHDGNAEPAPHGT
ncbi:MAG: DEAD/DEAH box helicase [Acidimicrobiales bacterium]